MSDNQYNSMDDIFTEINEDDIEVNDVLEPEHNDDNQFKFYLKMSAKNNIDEIQSLVKLLDRRMSMLPDSMKCLYIKSEDADRIKISPDKKRISFYISFLLSISDPSLNDIEMLRKIMNIKIDKIDSHIRRLDVYLIRDKIKMSVIEEIDTHFLNDTADELFGSKYETILYAQLCDRLTFGKITLGMIYHKFNPHYLRYSVHHPGYIGTKLIDCHKFITQEYHRKFYNINDIPQEICNYMTADSICSAMNYAITLQKKYSNDEKIHYMHSFHMSTFQVDDYVGIMNEYYNHTVSLVSLENEAIIQAKSYAKELARYRLKTPHRYIAKTVGSDVLISFSLGDYLNNDGNGNLYSILVYFDTPKDDADKFFRILFNNNDFKY